MKVAPPPPDLLAPAEEVGNENSSWCLEELAARTPRASLFTCRVVAQFHTKSACALLAPPLPATDPLWDLVRGAQVGGGGGGAYWVGSSH